MDRSRYRIAHIPKRCGSTRTLEIPDATLMMEQRKIHRWLCARRLAASPYSHAYTRHRSIATNALPHVGKAVVVKLDLKDFFPSVTAGMVREALVSNGIAPADSDSIAETCTLDDRLPQGAPTSPFLSNLVATRMDHRLAGLARKWRNGACRTAFSRYADDLCFSSDDRHLNHIIAPAKKIIEQAGFRVNAKKTRVYRRGGRQVIAGVVVNDRLNVPRTVRRNLRAELHQAREAILRGDKQEINVGRMRGMAAHVYSINPQAGAPFLRDVDEIGRLLALSARR